MSAERQSPEKRPDFIYYTLYEQQLEKLEKELEYQGFNREDHYDKKYKELIFIYVDENGSGVLISPIQDYPGEYMMRVDCEITNLVEETIIDIEVDEEMNDFTNQAYYLLKAMNQTPPRP